MPAKSENRSISRRRLPADRELSHNNSLTEVVRFGFAELPELRSQSADVVNDLVFRDESFRERCSGNMRPLAAQRKLMSNLIGVP